MTTYYADPILGNDGNGGGISDPWEHYSYACGQVSGASDIIHLNAGGYNDESSTGSLAVDVDLEGPIVDFSYPNFTTSPTAVIRGWSGANPMLNLTSVSEGTNGNQTIKYIKWDGNGQVATQGIRNYRRKNVEIFNCEFIDFLDEAIWISGKGSNGEPTTHAIGIKVYDSKFDDCSRYSAYGRGTITIGGTEDAEIYNIYIDSSTRNGYGVKYAHATRAQMDVGDVINKGLLIHDSELHADPAGPFGFAIELWGSYDDCKVYDNTVEGCIDFDTLGPGGGTYGIQIYGNTIYNSGSVAACDGVTLDKACNGVLVRDNYVYNRQTGFMSGNATGMTVQNISIYRNVYYNIGVSGGGRRVIEFKSTATVDTVNIWNNILDDSNVGRTTSHAITFATITNVNTLSIRNNIFRGRDGHCIASGSGVTIDGFTLTHNYYYDMGGWTTWGGSVSNKTENNNTNADPDLTDSGDKPDPFYRPTSGNLVDAGVDVGLSYSGSAPDIGRYEYEAGQTISAAGAIASAEVVGGTLLYRLNRLYDKGREAFLGGDIAWVSDTIKAVLVDGTDYTLDIAAHDFLSDIPSAAQVAKSDALAGKTTILGVADANDLTITTVSGDEFEYIILFKDTGDSTTSPLIICIDSAVGLPFTPEGGSVKLKWNDGVNKIFKL